MHGADSGNADLAFLLQVGHPGIGPLQVAVQQVAFTFIDDALQRSDNALRIPFGVGHEIDMNAQVLQLCADVECSLTLSLVVEDRALRIDTLMEGG